MYEEIVDKIRKLELKGTIDDTYLAKCIFECLQVKMDDGTVVAPRGDQKFIYVYNPKLGVFKSLEAPQLRLFIHNLSGLKTGKNRITGRVVPLRLTSARVKSILTMLYDICDVNDPQYFTQTASGLACKNGFVEVTRHGISLQSHSPHNRATYNVGVNYDPGAQCPHWLDTLQKVFSKTDDSENCVKALQQFTGACLLGKATYYTRAVLLFGGGSNGKSTIIETIANLFPHENVTYSSPINWISRFTLSRLKDSMLNIAGELPNRKILATDVFKTVLDGGAIDAEFKGKDHFSLYPRAGHIFSSNFMPTTDDTSFGFWRRLILLPGWYDFSKDPNCLPKEEIVNIIKSEKAGVIRWALEGAVELLNQKGYTIPACSETLIRDIRDDNDSVKSWITDDCITEDPEAWASTETLWEGFKKSSWSDSINMTKIGFAKRLVELGFQRKVSKHAKLRGFKGIDIRPRTALDKALLNAPITRAEQLANKDVN